MELLLLIAISFKVFFFLPWMNCFISSPPPTYQKLLFILISVDLCTFSWLFSTFFKMPDTKGSICFWSLQFACLLMFTLTYCTPLGEDDLQTTKGHNSFFKSCLRCVVCVLRHTPFFISAEIATFLIIATKIRVSLFSCSLVMTQLRTLGRGQFQTTCPQGISDYK